ncbi:hypothetical protein [Lysobacter gummosus]|uniref:hypothetical protein n=1 Tax=Lysobacter gummosus TaxID=262324 RepID=UPI0036416A5F
MRLTVRAPARQGAIAPTRRGRPGRGRCRIWRSTARSSARGRAAGPFHLSDTAVLPLRLGCPHADP